MSRTREATRPAEGWWQNFKADLRALSDQATLWPIGLLFGLNFVDEFDRIAFETLVPEIRDAFNLSDTGIAAIATFAAVFVLLSALPMGYLGDRTNRVRLSGGAALVWGAMMVSTGLAFHVIFLFFVRLVSGIGRLSTEVVHPSLLTDYYRQEHHPAVFRIHRFANPTAAIAGILAGLIGSALGWRYAFFLLAIPTFVLVAGMARLREPSRGQSIDAELAEKAEEAEGSIPFGEAKRQLYSILTLRRLWTGALFLGVGFIPLGTILSLFFDNVYAFGPLGRGVVQTLRNVGVAVGVVGGAWLAGRYTRTGNVRHLATIVGASFVWFGAGIALMGLMPWAAGSAFIAFVLSIGAGAYQPAYYSLVGQVAPPRVRTQAYAWAILFVGLGGILSLPLISFAETFGFRYATLLFSAIVMIAGFIGISARRFVERDIDQATKTLETAVNLREELGRTGEQALLMCRDVEVAYGQVQVLFGVNMEVRRGEIVALLGTNGAGKSTMLKAISGIVDPIGGAIFFDGRDITHADANQTAEAGIAQVPGGRGIFPTLSVGDNIRAAGWLYRTDPAYREEATERVLEYFPVLRERWHTSAGSLSGGEQQMLSLAQAFIARPKLLLIDELSLGLAPTIVQRLLDIVRAIHANGTTVVLVEQSVNTALTLAERAIFMEKGEVRFEGPTRDLLDRPDILRAVFLKGSASANGDVPTPEEPSAEQLAKAERIRLRAADPRSGNGERPAPLRTSGLTKAYGGVTAVRHVDIELHHGELLGLIGPNGAGKTSLFDLISGFTTPDSGRIELHGVDITHWGPHARARAGLGRSFQDARLWGALTVKEALKVACERHVDVRAPVAAVFNLPVVDESERAVDRKVEELIEVLGLGAFRDKFVSELSTGSRRIVEIAAILCHEPSVLILDEPSSGIAQKETEALGPMLRDVQERLGCSLLVIEHDMPLITSIADRIYALDQGAVVTDGTPDEVTSHPHVVESYLGSEDLSDITRAASAGAGRGRAKSVKGRSSRR